MSKSILITGATRGLGKGLASQFASRGYQLALTGRSEKALEELHLAGRKTIDRKPRCLMGNRYAFIDPPGALHGVLQSLRVTVPIAAGVPASAAACGRGRHARR